MNYLSVESVSKTFGTKSLFDKISFGVNQGQRIALVARNGAGKSTLLKIIMGSEIADEGIVTFRKELTVTYLDQHPPFNEESTVMDFVYNTNNPMLNAVKAYEESLEAYGKDVSDRNAEKFHEATELMDKLSAWDYETKVKEILSRLNIAFLDKKIGTLSGGQKKRIALANVLINEPDLLILDEPTNHLDVEMIEWLEEYLVSRNMTLLIVTHDRYFLDSICTEIIEIDNAKLHHYKGNFQYYVEKKAEREQIESSEIDKAKNLYKRELEWVRKMPRGRGTKAKARVDAFSDVEEKAFSRRTEEKLQMDVKMTRLGGKILELIKVSKSFKDEHLIKTFSYVFKKGEKIGIVGKNGSGKTTLLNMIMGTEPIDTGKIQTGETIVYGYYSQTGMKLNEDKRVIEVIKDIADYIPLADGSKLTASQLLLRFQFSPDVQYNFVSKLSGGEKRRLYLLTVLMKNPNFLILDEPTNDLDLLTLSTLEDFLTSYQGCVLIVTHDRYFMDKLVDHLFVFEGEGIIRDFPGNYTQYREKLDQEKKSGKRYQPQEDYLDTIVAEKPAQEAKRKLSFKEKTEFEQLEKEMAQLEIEKKELNEKLSAGSENQQEIIKWSERIGVIMKELDEKSGRWLELVELT